ncbi:Fur-regulated basic protein FbpA [Aquibacillus halophilus]|uniref:Fur-regulated basic protein FbpA n=1 Tax=Aquibacillus halophilus TaxID=930132 RepID=A0A6A8DKJ8_9BACI|nr:Fur-regulated basic protein FbpA [Aquibacillus halophilus]MRH44301.1 Fur-regulated basic protein FbpA [Aquibacillus halophilus]
MSYLRAAVDQRKSILIKKLIQAGVYNHADTTIYSKTITELELEYKQNGLNKKEFM